MRRQGIDAALLLDKPVGLTSNRALQEAKKLLAARKAGHAGTLDPLASGLLVALFGEATKFAGPLLDADKEYLATLKLGETTTTGDAEGEVLERKAVEVPDEAIAAALEGFRGEIEQVPPMYSALKRGGVPLYRLARRGEQVERPPRRVAVSRLEMVGRTGDRVELAVRCSKGTYVRVLAEDIGRALGSGAHLAALRRTAAGGFRVDEAMTLEALAALAPDARLRRLIPLERLLGGLPRAELDPAAEGRFRNGQALALAMPPGLCGVFRRDGAVIGLGRADSGGALRPLRLTQAAENHR